MNAEETKRLDALSKQTVTVVGERVMAELVRTGTAEEAEDRVNSEKLTMVCNRLRLDEEEPTVSYDAELIRPSDWVKKSALVKIFAEKEQECGYALLKNKDCGGGVVKETIPSVVHAPSFEEEGQSQKVVFYRGGQS